MMQLKTIKANSETDMFIMGTYKKDYVALKLVSVYPLYIYQD
jgi:hypothetical protein